MPTSSISTSWTGTSYLRSRSARWWSLPCRPTPTVACTATSWSRPPSSSSRSSPRRARHRVVPSRGGRRPRHRDRQGAQRGPRRRRHDEPGDPGRPTSSPYLDPVDDVLPMSIEPGWSGQTLDPAVVPSHRGGTSRDRSPRARHRRRDRRRRQGRQCAPGCRRRGDRAHQCERHLPGGGSGRERARAPRDRQREAA